MTKLSITTAGAALFVLGIVGIAPAQAAILGFNLSGTLAPGFNDPFGQLGSVKTGDPVTANFTINDQALNDLSGQPCPGPVQSCGRYAGAISDFNLQVGKLSFRLSDLPSVDVKEAVLLNNFLPPYPPQDVVFIVIAEKPDLQGSYIRFTGIDTSSNALSSSELVGFDPSLLTNPPANVVLSYADNRPGSESLSFQTENIKINAVPEPSSTLLNTLAVGTILGTGLVLKAKRKI